MAGYYKVGRRGELISFLPTNIALIRTSITELAMRIVKEEEDELLHGTPYIHIDSFYL